MFFSLQTSLLVMISVLGEYKSHTLEIGNMSDLPAVAIAHVVSKVSASNSWYSGHVRQILHELLVLDGIHGNY